MTEMAWIIILFVIMFSLMALGLPVGYCMAVAASIVFAAAFPELSLTVIPPKLLDVMNQWIWLCIPLFLMLGYMLTACGITEKLINFAEAILGHIAGGLSHITVLVNVMMAGMSGSQLADCAAIGSIMIPPMKKRGFPAGYCAAIVGFGSLIGPLIPPSMHLIIVGTLADISILRLWLGAAIPGVLVGVTLLGMGYVISKRRGYAKMEAASWGRRVSTFGVSLPALIIPVLLLGGLRIGLLTPTEAGAGAVVYAALIGLLIYRVLTVRRLVEVSLIVAKTTGQIGLIIVSGSLYGLALSYLRAGPTMADFAISVSTSSIVFLCAAVILLLIMGCIVEAMPLTMIFLPLFMPAVHAFGIDPVQWGVIFSYTILLGTLTPPVGVTMYLALKISNTSVAEYVRHGWPFLVALMGLDFVLIFFPAVITWLPNLVMGPATYLAY